MTARQLWHRHGLALVLAVTSCSMVAQGTPLTVGPLTVVVPNQWIAQTATAPIRIGAPGSNAQQYFTAQFLPPQQTPQDVREHHALIWGRMAKLIRPVAPPQSGVLGRFIGPASMCSVGSVSARRSFCTAPKRGLPTLGSAWMRRVRTCLRQIFRPSRRCSRARRGATVGRRWPVGVLAEWWRCGQPADRARQPGHIGEYVYTPPGVDDDPVSGWHCAHVTNLGHR